MIILLNWFVTFLIYLFMAVCVVLVFCLVYLLVKGVKWFFCWLKKRHNQ